MDPMRGIFGSRACLEESLAGLLSSEWLSKLDIPVEQFESLRNIDIDVDVERILSNLRPALAFLGSTWGDVSTLITPHLRNSISTATALLLLPLSQLAKVRYEEFFCYSINLALVCFVASPVIILIYGRPALPFSVFDLAELPTRVIDSLPLRHTPTKSNLEAYLLPPLVSLITTIASPVYAAVFAIYFIGYQSLPPKAPGESFLLKAAFNLIMIPLWAAMVAGSFLLFGVGAWFVIIATKIRNLKLFSPESRVGLMAGRWADYYLEGNNDSTTDIPKHIPGDDEESQRSNLNSPMSPARATTAVMGRSIYPHPNMLIFREEKLDFSGVQVIAVTKPDTGIDRELLEKVRVGLKRIQRISERNKERISVMKGEMERMEKKPDQAREKPKTVDMEKERLKEMDREFEREKVIEIGKEMLVVKVVEIDEASEKSLEKSLEKARKGKERNREKERSRVKVRDRERERLLVEAQ